jgi:hypothetical protein
MNFRAIIVMVAASCVLIAAVSANTTDSRRTHRAHLFAPVNANQQVSDSSRYGPPRSPAFNHLTGS